MGSFAGTDGIRPAQMLVSAVKVPLLLLVTFAVSLPSFFMLNTLAGVRGDFAAVMRALVEAQAVMTTVLASLLPFTLLWYTSGANYHAAIVFNGLMFAIAACSGQLVLQRHYRPLVKRRPIHRILLYVWLAIYGFVGIQMGWVLRPFIGDPANTTTFFRAGAWSNAYVELSRIIISALGSSY